jgi:hypothetical protein
MGVKRQGRKTFLLALLAIGIASLCPSCLMTASHKTKIELADSARHEFSPVKRVQGTYQGAGTDGFHRYVFPNALIGEPKRDLIVLLPLAGSSRGVLRDRAPDSVRSRQDFSWIPRISTNPTQT